MLQYFKNQVKCNVLQSFQHAKSDSQKMPSRMVSGHLHYTSKKNFPPLGKKKFSASPIPSNAHGETRNTEEM